MSTLPADSRTPPLLALAVFSFYLDFGLFAAVPENVSWLAEPGTAELGLAPIVSTSKKRVVICPQFSHLTSVVAAVAAGCECASCWNILHLHACSPNVLEIHMREDH